MPKIIVIGDIHGKIDELNKLLDRNTYDFALQVGDFGTYLSNGNLSSLPKHRRDHLGQFEKYYNSQKPLKIPTYFCEGNHEDFELLDRDSHKKEIIPNLFYIPNGQVIKVMGVSIGFLGGNFSSKWYDKPIPTNCNSQKIRGYLRKNDIEPLKNYPNKIDILVTHEPSFIPKFDSDRTFGCEPIHDLVTSVKPKYAFSGHIHKYAEGELDNIKCVSLGAVGYRDKCFYELIINL